MTQNSATKAERAYMIQYKEFTELYNAKNYEAICDGIIFIPTETPLAKYYVHYEAQITCSLFALSNLTKLTAESKSTNITHLTSCFVHLLKMVTAKENLITAVNSFGNLDKNASALNVLGRHCSDFLCGIRRCLQLLLLNVKDKTIQLIAGLNKCLLVFAKAEYANNEQKMVQTTKLLYVIKDAAAKLGINTWKCLDVVYQVPPNMEHLVYELNLICRSKEHSVANENVIFSAALIWCANKSVISTDLKTVTYAMNSISLFIEQLTNAAPPTNMICCYSCKSNFIEHTVISISTMAQTLFIAYCNTMSPIDAIWKACARLTVLQLTTIGSIRKCKHFDVHKETVQYKLNQICRLLAEHKVFAASGVKFLAHIIENCDIHQHVAPYMLMRAVFGTYDNLEEPQYLKIIHTGYILAAIIMLVPKHAALLKYVMARICEAQAKLGCVPSVEEYFDQINYRYLNRVAFPRVSISELLLCQLQYSLECKGFPAEIKAKLSNAVKTKTTTEPMQYLRVVYSYESGLPTKEQYENLIHAYTIGKQNAANLSKAVQLRWWSLVGCMENLSYRVAFNETTEMYKDEPLNLKEDRRVFKDLNLAYEAKMLRMLIASTKALQTFDSLLTKDNIESVRVEAEHGVRQLIQLATHLTLRQYRKEAMVAYTVLYSLSSKLNNEFGHFAALGYFAGNSRDYPERSRNSLRKIVQNNLEALVEVLKDRERLSFRKQSSLLVCLMNIGLYYMGQGNTDDGKEVLRFVEQMMTDFEAQFKIQYNNSVRMRLNTINLKLITKYDVHSPFPPIRLAEHILQSVKNMKYLTKMDAADLPIVLNEAMVFIARYCLARYDFDEIELIVQMLVKQSMRQGLVYSAAKLISMYALFDLYKEDRSSCLMKLKNLDNIVTLFDKGNDESVAFETEKNGNALVVPTSRSQQNSPVRRQIGRCISPIRTMSNGLEIPFEKYLIEHHSCQQRDCLFCSNVLVKELLLEMAWLHARTFFVGGEFQTSMLAFRYLHEFWTRHNELQKINGEIGYFVDRLSYTNCMMLWHYGQSLMRLGKCLEATEMLSSAIKWYRNCDYVDFAMEQDITMQLEDGNKVLATDVMTMIKPIRLKMEDDTDTQSNPVVSPLIVKQETVPMHLTSVKKTNTIPIKEERVFKSSPTKIATSTKTIQVETHQTKAITANAKLALNLPTTLSDASKTKISKAFDINRDNDNVEKEVTTTRRVLKKHLTEQSVNLLNPEYIPPTTRFSRRLRKQ